MNCMLRIAMALSLLNGASAMAQPYNQNQNNNGYEQNRNDRGSNQNQRDNSNARKAAPRFSRGDRLPDQYRQNQYAVNDWQQRGLKKPPGGYHWVRNDNNDFFLAAIATGVIADALYRDDLDQRWRQSYSQTYTYNDDSYYQQCRNSPDPAGVIVGALDRRSPWQRCRKPRRTNRCNDRRRGRRRVGWRSVDRQSRLRGPQLCIQELLRRVQCRAHECHLSMAQSGQRSSRRVQRGHVLQRPERLPLRQLHPGYLRSGPPAAGARQSLPSAGR